MAELAIGENITDNYVSNLIHLGWLSPDLVGRVLEGDPEATAVARAAMLSRKSDALWERK
jgi:site-specific DNA recombinase